MIYNGATELSLSCVQMDRAWLEGELRIKSLTKGIPFLIYKYIIGFALGFVYKVTTKKGKFGFYSSTLQLSWVLFILLFVVTLFIHALVVIYLDKSSSSLAVFCLLIDLPRWV